jgi:hypothetical protein
MSRVVSIDISDNAELLRIAEEVQTSQSDWVLRRGDEPLAVVKPVRRRRSSVAKAEADREAFLSSFGSWRELVDVDTFERLTKASRASSRPPVQV